MSSTNISANSLASFHDLLKKNQNVPSSTSNMSKNSSTSLPMNSFNSLLKSASLKRLHDTMKNAKEKLDFKYLSTTIDSNVNSKFNKTELNYLNQWMNGSISGDICRISLLNSLSGSDRGVSVRSKEGGDVESAENHMSYVHLIGKIVDLNALDIVTNNESSASVDGCKASEASSIVSNTSTGKPVTVNGTTTPPCSIFECSPMVSIKKLLNAILVMSMESNSQELTYPQLELAVSQLKLQNYALHTPGKDVIDDELKQPNTSPSANSHMENHFPDNFELDVAFELLKITHQQYLKQQLDQESDASSAEVLSENKSHESASNFHFNPSKCISDYTVLSTSELLSIEKERKKRKASMNEQSMNDTGANVEMDMKESPSVSSLPPALTNEQLEEHNNTLKRHISTMESLKNSLTVEISSLRDNESYLILGFVLKKGEVVPLAQIKKAYHKLAIKLHPDRKGGDKARFQELQTAYQEVCTTHPYGEQSERKSEENNESVSETESETELEDSENEEESVEDVYSKYMKSRANYRSFIPTSAKECANTFSDSFASTAGRDKGKPGMNEDSNASVEVDVASEYVKANKDVKAKPSSATDENLMNDAEDRDDGGRNGTGVGDMNDSPVESSADFEEEGEEAYDLMEWLDKQRAKREREREQEQEGANMDVHHKSSYTAGREYGGKGSTFTSHDADSANSAPHSNSPSPPFKSATSDRSDGKPVNQIKKGSKKQKKKTEKQIVLEDISRVTNSINSKFHCIKRHTSHICSLAQLSMQGFKLLSKVLEKLHAYKQEQNGSAASVGDNCSRKVLMEEIHKVRNVIGPSLLSVQKMVVQENATHGRFGKLVAKPLENICQDMQTLATDVMSITKINSIHVSLAAAKDPQFTKGLEELMSVGLECMNCTTQILHSDIALRTIKHEFTDKLLCDLMFLDGIEVDVELGTDTDTDSDEDDRRILGNFYTASKLRRERGYCNQRTLLSYETDRRVDAMIRLIEQFQNLTGLLNDTAKCALRCTDLVYRMTTCVAGIFRESVDLEKKDAKIRAEMKSKQQDEDYYAAQTAAEDAAEEARTGKTKAQRQREQREKELDEEEAEEQRAEEQRAEESDEEDLFDIGDMDFNDPTSCVNGLKSKVNKLLFKVYIQNISKLQCVNAETLQLQSELYQLVSKLDKKRIWKDSEVYYKTISMQNPASNSNANAHLTTTQSNTVEAEMKQDIRLKYKSSLINSLVSILDSSCAGFRQDYIMECDKYTKDAVKTQFLLLFQKHFQWLLTIIEMCSHATPQETSSAESVKPYATSPLQTPILDIYSKRTYSSPKIALFPDVRSRLCWLVLLEIEETSSNISKASTGSGGSYGSLTHLLEVDLPNMLIEMVGKNPPGCVNNSVSSTMPPAPPMTLPLSALQSSASDMKLKMSLLMSKYAVPSAPGPSSMSVSESVTLELSGVIKGYCKLLTQHLANIRTVYVNR